MKQITEEMIKQRFCDKADCYADAEGNVIPIQAMTLDAVLDLAEWVQEQIKSEWVPFESMTKEQKIVFNAIDSKRIMLLFDNGDVCRFNEDHPFALMVAVHILPELPEE